MRSGLPNGMIEFPIFRRREERNLWYRAAAYREGYPALAEPAAEHSPSLRDLLVVEHWVQLWMPAESVVVAVAYLVAHDRLNDLAALAWAVELLKYLSVSLTAVSSAWRRLAVQTMLGHSWAPIAVQ